MPKEFGFRKEVMHKISELPPIDKFLQKRAEWVLENAGVEKYLKKGGSYLDVGMGKGHVVQRVLEDKVWRSWRGISLSRSQKRALLSTLFTF